MSNKGKGQVTQAKPTTQAPVASKGGFDAKQYAKNGVSEEEVNAAKAAFDLFDSDQGGSVDIRGTLLTKYRTKGGHDITRVRI